MQKDRVYVLGHLIDVWLRRSRDRLWEGQTLNLVEVLQISLHQCKVTYHILSKWLQKVQTYICLIQESWFIKERLRGINSVDG